MKQRYPGIERDGYLRHPIETAKLSTDVVAFVVGIVAGVVGGTEVRQGFSLSDSPENPDAGLSTADTTIRKIARGVGSLCERHLSRGLSDSQVTTDTPE